MRPDWDEYFLRIATEVATRSTCNRRQVGCVLVSERRILSTGYGGSIQGQAHCTDVGCEIDPVTGGCMRTVHAEMNALAQAARNGVSTMAATAYTTLSPCLWCFKTLVNAGICRIVYSEEYRIPLDRAFAQSCGVELVHLHSKATATPVVQVPFIKHVTCCYDCPCGYVDSSGGDHQWRCGTLSIDLNHDVTGWTHKDCPLRTDFIIIKGKP